jgi:ribosome-associated toxin RatA of RatAB toxin-antitoxin module
MKFLNGFSTLEKGAQVYTESIEGIRMDTEYLSFDAPNKISIRMLNRSSLFSLFIGTWHYIQLAEDRTSLKITYQFSLRFPFILIKKLVSRRIKANITKKLTDLEIHLSKLTS